jgi:hypothetical protein
MAISRLLRCPKEVAQPHEISSEVDDRDVDADVHGYPPFDDLRGEAPVQL